MANIPEPHPAQDSSRTLLVTALVTVLATSLGWLAAGAFQLGPIDDAFISLRYAENWANGDGLAFNPGERVEGYTNFLMVAMEALLIRLGFDPVVVMSGLSWASLALLVALQTWAVGSLLTPGRPVMTLVIGGVLAVNPMYVCWGASGMETHLYAALILATFLVLTLGREIEWVRWGGLLLALAGLCRPEAVAMTPVAILIAFSRAEDRSRGVRMAGRFLLWFAVPYGIYFLSRWGHFGYLLPNTFYAKHDFGGPVIWQRGVLYVWDFLRAAPLVSILALLGVGLGFTRSPWIRAFTLVVLTQMAVVIYEGGDHFAMFRFMVASLPFLYLLALSVPVGWASSARLSRAAETLVMLVVLFAVGISSVRLGRQEKRYELPDVRHFARFKAESEMARDWAEMGGWLNENSSDDASLATIAVGAIGFYSERRILDPLGLTDPEIAHRKAELGSGYIGHEKFDVDSVFESRPDYLLLANLATESPIPEGSLRNWAWGAFNQGMLADPRLDQLYLYDPVEIAPGRWMNLHRLRD